MDVEATVDEATVDAIVSVRLAADSGKERMNGIEFTAIGSDGDGVTPAASALHLSIRSSSKVIYGDEPHSGGSNRMHTSR